MSEGRMYIPVEGNVASGIMTINGSTSGGGEESGYWLYWTARGYTNISWYWEEPNNYVQIGWPNYVNGGTLTCSVKHTPDVQGLEDHINGGHADDLNAVLGPWPQGDKMQFIGRHWDEFMNAGCITE